MSGGPCARKGQKQPSCTRTLNWGVRTSVLPETCHGFSKEIAAIFMSSRRQVSSSTEPMTPRACTAEQHDGGAASQPRTLLYWHEIPSWQQDNEFILSGYRSVFEDVSCCRKFADPF